MLLEVLVVLLEVLVVLLEVAAVRLELVVDDVGVEFLELASKSSIVELT